VMQGSQACQLWSSRSAKRLVHMCIHGLTEPCHICRLCGTRRTTTRGRRWCSRWPRARWWSGRRPPQWRTPPSSRCRRSSACGWSPVHASAEACGRQPHLAATFPACPASVAAAATPCCSRWLALRATVHGLLKVVGWPRRRRWCRRPACVVNHAHVLPLQVEAAYETVKEVVMGEAEELEKKADAQKGRASASPIKKKSS
jgi:hypothetical protein